MSSGSDSPKLSRPPLPKKPTFKPKPSKTEERVNQNSKVENSNDTKTSENSTSCQVPSNSDSNHVNFSPAARSSSPRPKTRPPKPSKKLLIPKKEESPLNKLSNTSNGTLGNENQLSNGVKRKSIKDGLPSIIPASPEEVAEMAKMFSDIPDGWDTNEPLIFPAPVPAKTEGNKWDHSKSETKENKDIKGVESVSEDSNLNSSCISEDQRTETLEFGKKVKPLRPPAPSRPGLKCSAGLPPKLRPNLSPKPLFSKDREGVNNQELLKDKEFATVSEQNSGSETDSSGTNDNVIDPVQESEIQNTTTETEENSQKKKAPSKPRRSSSNVSYKSDSEPIPEKISTIELEKGGEKEEEEQSIPLPEPPPRTKKRTSLLKMEMEHPAGYLPDGYYDEENKNNSLNSKNQESHRASGSEGNSTNILSVSPKPEPTKVKPSRPPNYPNLTAKTPINSEKKVENASMSPSVGQKAIPTRPPAPIRKMSCVNQGSPHVVSVSRTASLQAASSPSRNFSPKPHRPAPLKPPPPKVKAKPSFSRGGDKAQTDQTVTASVKSADTLTDISVEEKERKNSNAEQNVKELNDQGKKNSLKEPAPPNPLQKNSPRKQRPSFTPPPVPPPNTNKKPVPVRAAPARPAPPPMHKLKNFQSMNSESVAQSGNQQSNQETQDGKGEDAPDGEAAVDKETCMEERKEEAGEEKQETREVEVPAEVQGNGDGIKEETMSGVDDDEDNRNNGTESSDEDDQDSSSWEDEWGEEEEEERIHDEEEQQEKSKAPKPEKARRVAEEIHGSEAVFVDVLKLLNEDFRKHIMEAKDPNDVAVVDDATINQLLGYLPQLQLFNEELMRDFAERLKNWDAKPKIADVFIKKGPYLKLYTSYVKDFEKITAALEDASIRCPHFAATLKEFEMSERCQSLAVRHYMLKPIQRIPQYKMLLTDYMKCLDTESEDYKDTETALGIVSEVANHVNEHMKAGDTFNKLLDIQHRIIGTHEIVKPGRRFLKEGLLLKISRKEEQQRRFFLLTDVLLVTTPFPSGQLRLNTELELASMKVKKSEREDYDKEFSIISQKRSFTLSASSAEERDKWVKALKDAVADYISKRSTFVGDAQEILDVFTLKPEDTMGLGKQAPIWIPDSKVTMCALCTSEFSLTWRRHHCRACGKVVCGTCSTGKANLDYLDSKLARVCDECYNTLVGHDDLNGPVSPLSPEEKIKNKPRRRKSHKKQHRPNRLKEVSANSMVGINMSGYLLKKERRSFKKKWFVLKEKVLFTYKASEDAAALESMVLLGYEIKRSEEDETIIQLYHNSKLHITLKADNTAQAEKWLAALTEATSI